MDAGTRVVLGVDGGGSHTRVLCASERAELLAYAVGGGANPQHDRDAAHNVEATMLRALNDARSRPESVSAVVFGCAGVDHPSDLAWARKLIALPGLSCKTYVCNDAEVAHVGALAGGPGVLAISGTGSIALSRNERGRWLRNYDALHYARSAARHLAYDTVHRLLASMGRMGAVDRALFDTMRTALGASSDEALFERVTQNGSRDAKALNQTYASLAPLVTAAASAGGPIAVDVCDRAVAEVGVGIRFLVRDFATRPVAVALGGAVLQSAYFAQRFVEVFADAELGCKLVPPSLPPTVGALHLALELAQCPASPTQLRALAAALRRREGDGSASVSRAQT